MALTIGQKWRARMKRFSFYKIDPDEPDKDKTHQIIIKSMETRSTRKIRKMITFGLMTIHNTVEGRAVNQLKPFVKDMKDHFKKRKLKLQCEEYYRKIVYMQNKIKSAIVYR